MSSSLQIMLGGVPVGGGAPVSIQSMTNTPTEDVGATLSQIRALVTAGADIVRIAVPHRAAAAALPRIVVQAPVPIVADVHFDHRLAVAAVGAGAAGVRINPGNIGGVRALREVVAAAQEHRAVIRVGVNAGSLERELRGLEERDPAGALVESARRNVAYLEDLGFQAIKVSVKSSSAAVTIDANRRLADVLPYPLHVGLTEAGTPRLGSIRSAVAMGALLAEGIGDTIRVSLTGDPVDEIPVAREILRSLCLSESGPRLVSCPTCARTQVDLVDMAEQIERRLWEIEEDLEIAVMGCAVNGPGEARKADYGIAGGRGEGVIFANGRPVKKVAQEHLVDELFALIAAEARDRRERVKEEDTNEGL